MKEKINSILFLLVCADLLKSIEFNVNWLEEILQQVTQFEELYGRVGSRFDTNKFIRNVTNSYVIMRR